MGMHLYSATRVWGSPQCLQVALHIDKANQVDFRGAKQAYSPLVSLVGDDAYSLRHLWYFKARHAQGSQVMSQST